jgi:putative ABC transport system permease protein
MWRATLKALLAQRVRLAMTTLAVAFGVAFVAGTFVLTDTMSRSFDDLFRTVNRGIAVEVSAVPRFEQDGPAGAFGGGPLSAAILDDVRRVPGVRAAAARRSGYAQILTEGAARNLGRQGRGGGSGASVGIDWAPDPALDQFVVHSGRPPRREGEILLVQPEGRAAAPGTPPGQGASRPPRVGDHVRVLLQSGTVEADVVGTAGFPTPVNFGVTLIAFDAGTAARVLGPDSITSVVAAAEPGVSPATLRDGIEQVLPAGVRARTGDEAASAQSDEIRRNLSFLNTGLLVFAGISIFVGAFIIFNTFHILVSQRTRELALFRAIGATPRQIRRSVTAEAAVVGVVASAAGVVGGVLLALGLRGLLGLFGVTLPGSGIVMQPRTVLAASGVGIGITLLSSVGPASAAARVPAIAALRDAQPAVWKVSRERVLMSVFLGCTGAALLVLGLFGGFSKGLQLVGAGAVVVFLGVAVFSAIVVRPVAGVIGRPLRAFGVPGTLGQRNAMRNPKRTASTAASLMVGLGVVSCVSIVGQSWKASASRAVQGTVAADYVVSSRGFQGFSPEVAARLRTSPAFSAVVEVREGAFGQGGRARRMDGVDAAALGQVLRMTPVSGSVPGLQDGEVLVGRKAADEKGWGVGDRIPVVFSRLTQTGGETLRIAGIFEDVDLLGSFVVTMPTFEQHFTATEQLDSQVLVRRAPGVTAAQAQPAVDAVGTAFPVVEIQDQAAFRRTIESRINRLLGFVTALLGLSIVVALFGIANTLALSVFERTREIGLLRAVGMAPRQVRAMVRWESVIIAVLGALLGIAVGTFFGWAIVRALASEGVTVLAAPVRQLAVSVLVAAVLGVVAAAFPARRAARLNVLDAIAYE